jgi:protein-tyrosine phosphatase
MLRLLVVCTANICRSPLAAAVLQKTLPPGSARIASAGVPALSGNPADPIVQQLARERGYGELSSHRSQPVLPMMLAQHDIVLAMEDRHVADILAMAPTLTGRVRRYAEPLPWLTNVADPVGKERSHYEFCLGVLEQGADQWRSRLANMGLIPPAGPRT